MTVFHRAWSPAEYIAPGASLGLLLADPRDRLFYATILLIALPFIATGITLTAMRLRSAGIAPLWCLLFFVPGINFLLFALLSFLPPRAPEAGPAPAPRAAPAPHLGAAPLLSYSSRDDRLPWLAGYLPAGHGAARAVAVFVPVLIALIATYASVQFLSTYGWGVFVGLPFAIGLMAALLYGAHAPCTIGQCIAVGCLSLTVYLLALLLIAFEGAVCLLMAAPLAYPLAIVGALFGATFRWRPDHLSDAARVIWVMLLFLPLFMGAERLAGPVAPAFAVTSSVEIDAPPARVWKNVIEFGQIPPPTELLFRGGIAYPIRARISGVGPGAMRHCIFSTGAFVEPIDVWDEPRLLKFAVTANPPPMKEWSPWGSIHPPHLENYLVSDGGQFKLIELSGHRTRLQGTTWYRHHMWPANYWRLWSDFIIHRIHLRVLNHVKELSEQ